MEIRQVTAEDNFAAIAEIYVQGWKSGYQGIVPQGYLDRLDRTRWEDLLRRQTMPSLVAKEGGRYIGTSSYCPSRLEELKGWGEIVSIYLLPEYWGKGIAAPLLDAAIAGLAGLGYDRVYLWVLAQNHRARRFYEKCGFTATDHTMTMEIGGALLEEVRYVYCGGKIQHQA